MAHQLKWRGYIPNNTWEGAVQFLNELGWNLSWVERDSNWKLLGGDQTIILVDKKEELEAFILGMALGLAVLPEEIINQVKKLIEE